MFVAGISGDEFNSVDVRRHQPPGLVIDSPAGFLL